LRRNARSRDSRCHTSGRWQAEADRRSSCRLTSAGPLTIALLLPGIEVRSELGGSRPASLADEERLQVGQPHMIRPTMATHRNRMAAVTVRAIDQQAVHPHFAHFTKRYFWRAVHQSPSLVVAPLVLSEPDLQGLPRIHASRAREAPGPTVSNRFCHDL